MRFDARVRRPGASLGVDFSRLWLASAVSNLGDGLTRAAVPLLALTITRDPATVGLVTFAQQLPWLAFPLVAGVWVDRSDRRRLAVAVNVSRGFLVAVLAVALWTGRAELVVLFVVVFGLATLETLADGVVVALVPSLVPTDRLARANGRIASTQIVADQLAGPALGGAIFALARSLPFVVDAISFALAALLLSRMRPPPNVQPGLERRSLRVEIVEGIRHLWTHPTLRLLGALIAAMNITFMIAFATWALYVREELDLGPVGFGVLLTVGAAGGLVGSLTVARLIDRAGAANVLRGGLVIEVLTHTVLGFSPPTLAAGATMFAFGIHAAASGVTALTIRQRATPGHLHGRVNSAYAILDKGGAAIGAALGATLAAAIGVAPVFWIAAAAMAITTVLAWRPLTATCQPPSP